MEPSLPISFGDYQLLERIAVGGMAEVYLARSFGVEGFEKRLVIKKIAPELAKNPRFVQMFVHEAKLSVALNHTNIVQVFDLGKVGNDPYMAMEYIHGRDLTQTLRVLRRGGGRIDVGLAVYIAGKTLRGLGYAHSRTTPDGRPLQIVHRDVSPHNIVVSFEGAIKLVDFGIARLVGESLGNADPAQAGRPGGGKFAYMSPEQARGEPVDGRSDLFSLGVVLYEMLAGKRLFSNDDPDEKLRQVIDCVIPDLRPLHPDVPDELWALLQKALSKDPADRYQDAATFEGDLRALSFARHWRADARMLGELMRELWAPELVGGKGVNDLELLAEDLNALHTGVDPEPDSSHSTNESASSAEDRGPRHLLAMQGERKNVTVMVVEVNGLTEFSARAETEEVGRVHFKMLRLIRKLVDHMGGVAERFDDDTLFVFFGLPRALGEDLDRALACAREFHRLAARLRRRGLPTEFSIGIHVGELNVGRRHGRHYRYTARGDTLKTCVRLAYAADPGTTLVSDRIAALAGDRFPFERGPELRRKGTRATRASFLLGAGRRRGGRGVLGRWLRRGNELEVVRDALASLRDGRGARIGVVGDAGSGKTRFFRELRDLASRRKIQVFHGRAMPFGADRPLAPFRDLVSDILGIEADTGAVEVRERLRRLTELRLDDNDVAVIATLYAMDMGDGVFPARDAVDTVMVKLVRGLAHDRPTIVMLEDIQYFDPFEAQLLWQLLEATDGQPVLLLCSWRGDGDPRLTARMQRVALGPLEPSQIEIMAADVLGAESIGPDLSRLVHRSTEGNPLYLEEVLKALRQAGRIWWEGRRARLKDPHLDANLPDTLAGLLAARVDALDPLAKGALQVAAVIGLGFSPVLLGEAVGADEPMGLVGELVRAGLVSPDGRSPDTAYSFCSVLVWDCVNRGILGVQRREYHRMVAAAMERVHGDRLDTVVESFAQHCHAGGRTRDAITGIYRAGENHRCAQFFERALDCFLKGMGWHDAAPRAERDPQMEARLHVAAGEMARLLGLASAERMLSVALDVAAEAGPRVAEARALLGLGQIFATQGKHMLARAHVEDAEGIARRAGDLALHVQCLEVLGALELDAGQIEEAQRVYEKGLAAAGDRGDLAARMLLGLANHAARRGDNDAALALLQKALPHAERAGDRVLLGRVINNIGIVFLDSARPAEALLEFRRALEMRRGLGYRPGEVVNLHNIGDALLRLGDHGRAWAAFEQSRDLSRECAWDRGVVMNEVFLHYLRGVRGEDVTADLTAAAATADRLGEPESGFIARWSILRLAGDRESVLRLANACADAGFPNLAVHIIKTTDTA
ncbi:MAG: tetratricopeptide repeat protein [Myxococcales bacterium]|nr:tetratricopeptide repeat protein [Myxococcales bacterium]